MVNHGKIDHIVNTINNTSIYFTYDPMGNRVSKVNYDNNTTKLTYKATYYVHDAQGNVMAIYEGSSSPTSRFYNLSDWAMYGSSQLGVVYPPKDKVIYSSQFGNTWTSPIELMNLGLKRYEIANHLGNVMATISDKAVGIDSITTNGAVEYYEPSVSSATDYYPFGMLMPGRNFKSKKYRFGFNGHEKDDEIKGSGNSYDFGARIYDPRLGRWLSPDPKEDKFPATSTYAYSYNNPIFFVDKTGKTGTASIQGNDIVIRSTIYFYGKIDLSNANQIARNIQNTWNSVHKDDGTVGYGSADVDGKSYNVRFEITAKVITQRENESDADYTNRVGNFAASSQRQGETYIGNLENNFVRVEAGNGTSHMAGNAGLWFLPELGNGSKTPGHEYGHGNQALGSKSHFLFYAPDGNPNIMAAKNQVENPNSRVVTEADISQIGLGSLLSGKTSATVGGIKSNQIYSQDGSYGVVSGGDAGSPGPVRNEVKN